MKALSTICYLIAFFILTISAYQDISKIENEQIKTALNSLFILQISLFAIVNYTKKSID